MESEEHQDDFELPRFGQEQRASVLDEVNNLVTSTSDQEQN